MEPAQRDSPRHTIQKVLSRLLHTRSQPGFGGEHVRSASRQHTHWNRRIRHAVNYFVESAIAAGRQDQICSRLNALSGDAAGSRRACGRHCGDCNSGGLQNALGPLEQGIIAK